MKNNKFQITIPVVSEIKTPWIYGGPFLEATFITQSNENFADYLSIFFQNFDLKIDDFKEIANIDLKNSYFSVPIYISLLEKEKSLLTIQRLSPKIVHVCFSFYGSKYDYSEYNQKKMTKQKEKEIIDFHKWLHRIFKFEIGGLGYEEDFVHKIQGELSYRNLASLLRDNLDWYTSTIVELIFDLSLSGFSPQGSAFKEIDKTGFMLKSKNFDEI